MFASYYYRPTYRFIIPRRAIRLRWPLLLFVLAALLLVTPPCYSSGYSYYSPVVVRPFFGLDLNFGFRFGRAFVAGCGISGES